MFTHFVAAFADGTTSKRSGGSLGRSLADLFGYFWSRRPFLRGLGVLLMAVAVASCSSADSSSPGRSKSETPCLPLAIVIDGSSSSRGERSQVFAADLVGAAAGESLVCAAPLKVAMVSGPGQVAIVLTEADLKDIAPIGPNRRVRESRLRDSTLNQISEMVDHRMQDAYGQTVADTTSISAMLTAAKDITAADGRLIVVTDGVNDDELLSLNRPLVKGEGVELARTLPAVDVEAQSIVFVGVGLVDATVPAPSPLWDAEVRGFVEEVCRGMSDLADCQVRGAATAGDLLS